MGTIQTLPITTLANISKEEFVKNNLKLQKPLLVKGGWTKDWPAYKKWNLDYLQSIAGETVVRLYNNEPAKGIQNTPIHQNIKEQKWVDWKENQMGNILNKKYGAPS